jgi:hypothetical protein
VFNYYTLWKAADKKDVRLRYYLKGFLYICLITIGLYFIHKPDKTGDYVFILISLMILFVVTYSGFFLKSIYRKRVNEFLKDEKNQHLLEKTRLTITENGITDITGKTELKISWDGVVKSIRNSKYYYLYISSIQAVIIPENCMTTAEKMQLDKLLSEHIPLAIAFNSLNYRPAGSF